MLEKQPYDSPPMYSPPYDHPSNGYGVAGSFNSPRSEYDPYPAGPGSFYMVDKPQHFYKWSSPPNIVKMMEGTIVVLCIGIFACVASTLVWDMQYGYGMGMGMGGYGSGGYLGGYSGGFSGGYGSGYYGNYYNSYPSPYSAKTSMIAMAAINFLASLGFFVASFSKTAYLRSRKFYLIVLVVSALLAFLQGIINIVYIIGVNPMAQSSQSMMYNPMLMMCQQMYGSGGYGGGMSAGGFTMYNQYLYHYCFVDPQEAVAMVCGFLVVGALVVAAFFSQKTRSKIWRYGKPNIYWEQPLTGAPEGRDVEDWVNHVENQDSVQDAPTVVLSEKADVPLKTGNSFVADPVKTDSVFSGETYKDQRDSPGRPSNPLLWSGGMSSSPSEDQRGVRRPAARRGKRARRNPELDESQYETEYTTGGETAPELDEEHWQSMFPEIKSDAQRQEYKREFDFDLRTYKALCAEMDDTNDQINKLNRDLDSLDEGTAKYQLMAEEYNQLKDLKRTPDYQAKKLKCRELRHKLFHIKRMVKNYDRGSS